MVLLDLLLAKFFDKINVSDQVSLLAGKSQNSKFESVKNLDDFLIHFIVMCKKALCSKIKANIFLWRTNVHLIYTYIIRIKETNPIHLDLIY